MKSPACRARQFATAFAKYYNDKFNDEWTAPKHPIETDQDPNLLKAFKLVEKERDIFLDFYKEHSTLTLARSPC